MWAREWRGERVEESREGTSVKERKEKSGQKIDIA